jgi:hypothetical protein
MEKNQDSGSGMNIPDVQGNLQMKTKKIMWKLVFVSYLSRIFYLYGPALV